MPIPLIIWAAAAGVGAFTAYKNKDKIKEFVDSDAGRELAGALKEAGGRVASVTGDTAVRLRMQRHVDMLLGLSDAEAVVGWPAFFLKQTPEEIGLLETYCNLESPKAKAAGNAERADRLLTLARTCANVRRG